MLIWIHGVSVGESLANITLGKALLSHYPKSNILFTSTTKTSEQLIKKFIANKPNLHYAKYPFDWPWQIHSFLEQWQPDIAIFGESELWPNMLGALRKKEIPSALINARLSQRSFKRWQLLPFLITPMLKTFSVVLAQSDEEAARYVELGAESVFVGGNLKFATPALSINTSDLKKLKTDIKDRPLLLFASTHSPEEEMAARLHQRLKEDFPDLLSVIVPRHPERGDKIIESLKGLNIAKRSTKQKIKPGTDIYLADTLGELGLFYALSPLAFIGNSLDTKPGGGHNLIEPAQLECAIVHGPLMHNFKEMDQEIQHFKGAIKIENEIALYKALKSLLKNPAKQAALQKAAKRYAESKTDVLPNILEKLTPLIDTATHAGS